jgi:hypothetical protein
MLGDMAVLHITYKRDRETSNADYDKFYRTITSYRSPQVVNIALDDPHRGASRSCLAETQMPHPAE